MVRRDIWSDDPTDALASTAAYLKGIRLDHGPTVGLSRSHCRLILTT